MAGFASAPVLLLLVVLVLRLPTPVPAKHCRLSSREVWRHDGGSFERNPEKQGEWIEFDNSRAVLARFSLVMDNGQQAVIQDAARNIHLVLQDGLAGINHDGGSQYQQLYKGGWVNEYDCT
eukprot:RCo035708